MSMSAHEPKSVCDNTETEGLKTVKNSKLSHIHPVTCQYATKTE